MSPTDPASSPVQTAPQKTVDASGRSLMHIKVYSPSTVYFNNDGYSISAVNDTGPFDILAHHHNFMTLLSPCELIIASKSGVQKIKIARGIMHVKADQVIVFLDV